MIRHPHYLEIPWEVHWHTEPDARHRLLWWLVAGITLLALFLVGVGVTGGSLL